MKILVLWEDYEGERHTFSSACVSHFSFLLLYLASQHLAGERHRGTKPRGAAGEEQEF